MGRVWCAVALALLIPAAAGAESLRESEFLDLLDAAHPAFAALSQRIGEARAEVARARVLANPVIDFEREAPEESPAVSTLSMAWTPPLDGRRGPHVKAATAGLDAATADFESATLNLRRDLRASFATWATASERRRIIETHAALIEGLAEQMEARAESGEESRLAARRVSLAALEVRGEKARADVAAAAAQSRAVVWADRDLSGMDPVVPELPPIPSETLSVEQRPDVAARRFELAQVEQQRRLAGRVLRFPEIRAGWQRIENGMPSGEGPVLGLAWSLPLFDRDQGDRIATDAQRSAARARLELTTRSARAELESARASYGLLREAAGSAIEALEDMDRVIESTMASFRLGESRLTDLLETLRSVLAARIAALDLYESALQAHRDLEVAAGRSLILQEG